MLRAGGCSFDAWTSEILTESGAWTQAIILYAQEALSMLYNQHGSRRFDFVVAYRISDLKIAIYLTLEDSFVLCTFFS